MLLPNSIFSWRRLIFSHHSKDFFKVFVYSPITLSILGAIAGIAFYVMLFERKNCPINLPGRSILNVEKNALVYDASQPRDMVFKSSRGRMFTELPPDHEKYFYAPCSKNCHPMIRALRVLGWGKVNTIEEGRLIFSYKKKDEFYDQLKSWQRFNHIPNSEVWHDLTMQTAGWKEYETKTGNWPYFVPETYSIHEEEDRKALLKRMKSGIKENWIIVGEGERDEIPANVTHLAAKSKELIHFFKLQQENNKRVIIKGFILQSYICNQLTYRKRKIAIRSFWMVASTDPLIVLYQDGYARIGYMDANLFKTTRDYHEAPLPKFEEEILRPYAKRQRRLNRDIRNQPLAHIRSQLKESISILVDTFREKAFQPPNSTEDGFAYYVTDSYLDLDLNIWLAKAYNESKLPEDRYFLIESNHNIFYGMGKVLTEIWDKQIKGESILPLQYGNGWQVVYAANKSSQPTWKYRYDGYKRKKVSKSCQIVYTNENREVEDQIAGEDG